MIILHTEASTGWGGQEIRILREAIGMRDRGHHVIIAARPESRLLANAEKENFNTLSVEFKRRNFLPLVLFFKKFIEQEQVDIVNTHSSKDSWLTLPAAKFARNKPLILRTRHLSTHIHQGFPNRFLYNYLPHYVITTGNAIKEQMINVNGFDAGKIVSIPTGVDIHLFDPRNVHGDLRRELSLSEGTPLIGMVSVLRSWKGHINLINAIPHVIRKMPGARFVIAGEGPCRPSIEKAVDDAGVRKYIYLIGHREDVSAIMSSLDILVHPSYANEGIPQSVLQAMAMEKPVIASDLAPLKEVVRDGDTGIIVPVNEPLVLASRILYLLENKPQALELGKAARRLVEKEFSFPWMLDCIESLYRKRQTA